MDNNKQKLERNERNNRDNRNNRNNDNDQQVDNVEFAEEFLEESNRKIDNNKQNDC